MPLITLISTESLYFFNICNFWENGSFQSMARFFLFARLWRYGTRRSHIFSPNQYFSRGEFSCPRNLCIHFMTCGLKMVYVLWTERSEHDRRTEIGHADGHKTQRTKNVQSCNDMADMQHKCVTMKLAIYEKVLSLCTNNCRKNITVDKVILGRK